MKNISKLVGLVLSLAVAGTASAQEKKVTYEAAVVEKRVEHKVEYKEIFADGKRAATLEEKTFKVKIQSQSNVNLRARIAYQTLEITVVDIDDETKVLASQRQYMNTLESANNMLFSFTHPKSGEVWVVGFRSSAGSDRMLAK